MSRWLVQLSGDHMDLVEFPRWFPDGEVFAIEENGDFFLVGSGFEILSDAKAVRAEAVRILERLTGVISLLWPPLRNPEVSHVIRESDDGRRDITVFAVGCSVRVKAGAAVAFSVGAPQQPPQRTQAQELLGRATGSTHLEQALSLWADPTRSWPRLYRVLEKIEWHLGKPVDAAGLCSDNQRDRFTQTANSAEAAGSDARHATGKT
jgi:hypothetical protein